MAIQERAGVALDEEAIQSFAASLRGPAHPPRATRNMTPPGGYGTG